MLWSYALTYTLFLVLEPFRKRVIFSAIISTVLGISLELLQYRKVISGTFDILDILFEITAVSLAVVIIKKEKKK